MNTEQLRELWRLAMTDPVMTADGFSCTKQDLLEAITVIDREVAVGSKAPDSALDQVKAPVYDERTYAARLNAKEPLTDEEKASLPRPPQKIAEALTPTQKARLVELVTTENAPAPDPIEGPPLHPAREIAQLKARIAELESQLEVSSGR